MFFPEALLQGADARKAGGVRVRRDASQATSNPVLLTHK